METTPLFRGAVLLPNADCAGPGRRRIPLFSRHANRFRRPRDPRRPCASCAFAGLNGPAGFDGFGRRRPSSGNLRAQRSVGASIDRLGKTQLNIVSNGVDNTRNRVDLGRALAAPYRFSAIIAAICAERTEYSTVKTTSSSISQNCPHEGEIGRPFRNDPRPVALLPDEELARGHRASRKECRSRWRDLWKLRRKPQM